MNCNTKGGILAELISKRELGRRLSVNESAVRKAEREGKLDGCIVNGKLDFEQIQKTAWYALNTVVRPKAGVSRKKALEKIEKQEKAVKKPKKKKAVKAKNQKIAGTPQTNPIPATEKREIEPKDTDDLLNIDIKKDLPLNDAIRLREVFGVRLDKLKLQEAHGILVKRSEVEKNLFDFGNQLKQALLTYPENVIDHVLAAPNKVEAMNIMKMKMNQILNRYANPDNWNLIKKQQA